MNDKPSLVIDDGRYSRMELIAWWDQSKLTAAKVMVVGVGALGNEVVKNLVLMGVGTIYVIDFDRIETSNLNKTVLFRQADCGKYKVDVAVQAARDLNPDTRVVPLKADVTTDVGLGLFRDVDVVIGCLDNREARLWVNRMCWRVSTPWVDGGIQEINGVVKVFLPPHGACYECAMTENDYRLINLRYSCPLLKRDDILAGKVPTSPTISSIIAGIQTQEALKLIHGLPVNDGAAFVFNGVVNSTYSTKFPFREDCLSHETYEEPLATELKSQSSTLGELFAVAATQLGSAELRLLLDRDLVVRLTCHNCKTEQSVKKCRQKLAMSDAICVQCKEVMKPELVHEITSASDLLAEKLCDLGIPDHDILQVRSNDKTAYFLLAADVANN